MRIFLPIVVLLLVLVVPAPVLAAAASGKPHIVLFLADDLTWNDVEPYGSKDVKTPNLTALARQSMKFERAFSPSPTCTPCRSALYSGLYPMRNGAHANHSFVKDGLRTLPHYMKDLGYRVVIAGKTHIGHRDHFPFEYLPDSNVMPEGRKEFLWIDLNTKAVDKLLDENDPQKQPLCLIVAAHSPHVFWLPNEGMYKPKQIHLPPTFVDGPVTRRERTNYYRDVTHMDDQIGEVLSSMDKHGYADNTMFLFTADQGAQWPFAKWSLYDAGIKVPLIVRWPGKVKEGTTTDSMVTLIDLLPTFVEAAGGTAPKDIDGRSILPVLTDPSKAHRDEVYAAHTGDKELNHAPSRCIRTGKYKYIRNLRPDIKYTTHVSSAGEKDGKAYFSEWLKKAEKDATAKAIIDRFYNKPAEELYDIEADPYELKNLAADPAHAQTLKDLRNKVDQWRVQQGEDLKSAPLPEDAVLGNPQYAG